MKHPYLALIVAVTLAGSGLILSGCDSQLSQEDASATTAPAMPPAVVNVIPVNFQSVPKVQTFSGRTVAYQTAEVRPQVSGIIDKVLFREGSSVKKGQPLYRINTDNYSASVESGQAAIDQAKANLITAQANYNNAIAELNSRQATLMQAESDVNRLKGLVEIDAISQQQFEQALTAYRTAQAAVQSAQATIAQSKAGIDSAKANIAAAQSNLKSSQLDLSRTVVRAPISGRTDRSAVTAGALVNAGQAEPLVTIANLSPIFVDISQSSSDLLKLRQQIATGQVTPGSNAVELVLEDGSTYPARGKLALAEAKVDDATGAVTLRAVFPNDNHILLPGMYVTARLIQSVIPNAVLLPQSAINRSPKGRATVNIVDKNNKINVRAVTIDGTFQDKWIITDGLQEGDQVVATGGANLKPQQEVIAKPANLSKSGAQARPEGQMPDNSEARPKASRQSPMTPQQAAQSLSNSAGKTTATTQNSATN